MLLLPTSGTSQPDGRRVRVDDVRGDLTTIMELLVEDLPDDETKALQAACLLPFFDTALAAAVGNIDEGAVIRFTGRAIIIKTSARMYPFRVHDAVRDAVKSAGPHASGGWSERDWASAARRGLAEAHSRYDAGKALHDDAAMIRALGLALRICQDYSLWDEWLTAAVPTHPVLCRYGGRHAQPRNPGTDARNRRHPRVHCSP